MMSIWWPISEGLSVNYNNLLLFQGLFYNPCLHTSLPDCISFHYSNRFVSDIHHQSYIGWDHNNSISSSYYFRIRHCDIFPRFSFFDHLSYSSISPSLPYGNGWQYISLDQWISWFPHTEMWIWGKVPVYPVPWTNCWFLSLSYFSSFLVSDTKV